MSAWHTDTAPRGVEDAGVPRSDRQFQRPAKGSRLRR